MVAASLLATIVAVGVSGRHRVSDRVCGPKFRAEATSAPRRLTCIDVPTFWINMDAAGRRRRKMQARLPALLAPGVCATRVPGVLVSDVARIARGAYWADGHAPTVEDAITLSHLRAAWTALATEPSAPAYLILEDDVAFTPLVGYQGVLAANDPANAPGEVHGAHGSSIRALVGSLEPEHWSIVQLETKVSQAEHWAALMRLWARLGRPHVLDKVHLFARGRGGEPCGLSPLPCT